MRYLGIRVTAPALTRWRHPLDLKRTQWKLFTLSSCDSHGHRWWVPGGTRPPAPRAPSPPSRPTPESGRRARPVAPTASCPRGSRRSRERRSARSVAGGPRLTGRAGDRPSTATSQKRRTGRRERADEPEGPGTHRGAEGPRGPRSDGDGARRDPGPYLRPRRTVGRVRVPQKPWLHTGPRRRAGVGRVRATPAPAASPSSWRGWTGTRRAERDGGPAPRTTSARCGVPPGTGGSAPDAGLRRLGGRTATGRDAPRGRWLRLNPCPRELFPSSRGENPSTKVFTEVSLDLRSLFRVLYLSQTS